MNVREWVRQAGGVAVLQQKTGLTSQAISSWINSNKVPLKWRMKFGLEPVEVIPLPKIHVKVSDIPLDNQLAEVDTSAPSTDV